MSFTIKTLFIAFFFILSFAGKASANNNIWEQHTLNNNKYVTVKNLKDYYRFPNMTKQGGAITLSNNAVKLQFTVNSHECFMNSVKFILSNPITSYKGKSLISQVDLVKLIDPVLRPHFIQDNANFSTVIIDAGHGGKDPGAVNKYGTEAYYNLRVAQRVSSYLKRQGFNVVMTRSDDTYLSLSERVQLANKYPKAIFISIHFNAGGGGRADGLETFTLSPKGVAHHGRKVKPSDHKVLQGNHQDSQNIALATAVHSSSMIYLGIKDRGVKRARYNVLCGIKHPAILIEGGFLSHPGEAKKIHTAKYQDDLAKGIASGVIKYKQALSRRR